MVGVLLGAMMFGYLADRSVLGKPKSWAKLGSGPLAGFKAGVAGLSARLGILLRSSEDCNLEHHHRQLLLSCVAQPGSQ